MLKISAIAFCVLFAFMTGVIFGAKKERAKYTTTSIAKIQKPLNNQKNLKLNPPEEIKIKNPPKNNSEKHYTVVLASFASPESAKKHVKNIKLQGFNPFYFKKVISSKTWHRVGIGSFKLKSDAIKLQKELSKNKFAKGSLISQITTNNQ